MHRTDAEGNVAGAFHPGNPAIGQKATRISADFLNAVQEEIVAVIEGANIALDKADNTQLAQAITALVAGVVGDGSGAVPTTRLLNAAGLATGGGSMAADRTITVTKATSTEVSAAIRDDVAVTPLGLAGLVGLTVSGGAWIIQLGETIMMLFSGTATGNGTTVLNLPQTFPTECKIALLNGGSSLTNAQDNDPYVSGKGVSSVSVFSARDTSTTVEILAIGR